MTRVRFLRKKGFFKKGILESQMTWIFILLAGSLILLVFYKVSLNQRQVSELRINAVVYSKLKTAITTFATGAQTKTEIETAGSIFKNTCNGLVVSNSPPIKLNIFSFEELNPKLQKLYVASIPWIFPFNIDNLIFLFEPETVFVIVNNDFPEITSTIEDSLPEGLKIEEESSFVDALNIKHYGKLRIVLIGDLEPQQRISIKEGVSVLVVKPSSNTDFGELHFYHYKDYELKDEGVSYYLGFPTLIAAMNSNKEIYDCNFKNLLKKLYYSTLIYEKRADIIPKNPLPRACKNALSYAKSKLGETAEKLDTMLSSDELEKNDLNDLYNLLVDIKNVDYKLVLNSCPEIY